MTRVERTPGGGPERTGQRIAVVGGGLCGLAAARDLLDAGHDVTIFESSSRWGGLVETIREDGWLVERGADSFIRTKPAGISLCEELGIADRLIAPCPQHQRALVVRDGVAHPVPDDFHLLVPRRLASLLDTPLLSTRAKLRALRESAVPPSAAEDDESLAEFTRRRWGQEMLERLVQPLVAGIYSADPERLSLAATMPQFVAWEREHGSLTAAGRVQRGRDSASGARYGLFASFPEGMQTLVDSLTQATGNATRHLRTPVEAVRPVDGSWRVRTPTETNVFDAVLMTTSPRLVSRLLPGVPELKTIAAASSVVVATGHRFGDFTHPLDLFGLVVPKIEGAAVTAISIASRKFPGRAPAGCVLLRTFLSAADADASDAGDADWIARALEAQRAYLGLRCDPIRCWVTRYPDASPQYEIGHRRRVAAIRAAIDARPGLFLAGSSYTGVGIPDTIASGRKAAAQIVRFLAEQPRGD